MNPILLRRSSLLAFAATLALSSIARAEPGRTEGGDAPSASGGAKDARGDAGAKDAASQGEPATAKKMLLVVDADDASAIDRDAFRANLESDLQLPIELRDATSQDATERQMLVQLRDGHVAVVTYRDGAGRTLSRAIEVTGDRRALASAAALLAENLAHDQTSDLLATPAPAKASAVNDTTAEATDERKPEAGPMVPVIVSLFYPVATNWGKPNATTPFALDLVFGRNGGIRGAELSGAVAFSSGRVDGAQIAGAANVANDVVGSQIAGAVNVANDTTGAQIAGAVNVANDVRGAQISGAVNVANDTTGAQISVVNVGGNVDGAQIGVVNVGKRVRGLQLGVVNVAESVEGASYGLVSLVKNGHVRGLAWGSAAGHTLYANAGIEWSSKYAYAIVHGAYTADHVGPGIRFGGRIPMGRFHLDGDVGTTQLLLANGDTPRAGAEGGGDGGTFLGKGYFPDGSNGRWLDTDSYSNHDARVLLGFDVTSFLSVFAGGGMSVSVANDKSDYVRLAPTFVAGLSVGN